MIVNLCLHNSLKCANTTKEFCKPQLIFFLLINKNKYESFSLCMLLCWNGSLEKPIRLIISMLEFEYTNLLKVDWKLSTTFHAGHPGCDEKLWYQRGSGDPGCTRPAQGGRGTQGFSKLWLWPGENILVIAQVLWGTIVAQRANCDINFPLKERLSDYCTSNIFLGAIHCGH